MLFLASFMHLRTTAVFYIMDSNLKYLKQDLSKDGVKLYTRKPCHCHFPMATVNNTSVCFGCIYNSKIQWYNGDIIKHTVLYGKYQGKTHAYVLTHDFQYCKDMCATRPESKLALLCNFVEDVIYEARKTER